MSNKVDLSLFSVGKYDKGASSLKIAIWYMVNAFVVRAPWNVFGGVKKLLLILFGAKVGTGLVIKNEVVVKFPWYFKTGKNVWLGEKCWIDNIAPVELGDNVCVSQNILFCLW